tara:strand:+ start:1898 stop:2137 length:240 start_codon:yes stop_codon:yes gene_type:complete
MAACLFLLTACFEDSKEEILSKTENVSDRAGLRKALGDPDDIAKLGPLETWTYSASNGAVAFVLAGDTLTLRKTEDKTE